MAKIVIEKDLLCVPWTQTLLGSHVNGRANVMSIDWRTRTGWR
jgi:hypothetical protein